MHRPLIGPLLIALAAGLATLWTLAPSGSGPGVTCDELYHVFQGKRLVTALRQQGFDFFTPACIDRNFDWQPGGPPVQAPLGYWILGGTQFLFDPAPDDPAMVSIAAARFAPAAAYALLIFLVGTWTARREGIAVGTIAAAATALMPRLFGHAHLAALDMLTTFFFVAALLAVVSASKGTVPFSLKRKLGQSPSEGRFWQFALAGVVWGCAVLVRLHGLLLAPPVVLWIVWRFRRKAALPLLGWLGAGGLTVLVGWPWLWLAPWGRFLQYLASGSSRQSIHVFYLGQVWSDIDVPWHYPWVMFAVTLPLGLLLLGLLGVWKGFLRRSASQQNNRCDSSELFLLVGSMAFVLLVFSWPGVPVYDGVRLFLMAFPLWAILAAMGAGWILEKLAHWPARLRFAAVGSLVALQGIGLIIYCPCNLSYYNLLTGGLKGAARLGFETTYWGETIREPMLAEAARLSEGSPILFAPNLAPFQSVGVALESPALQKSGVSLVGWNLSTPESAKSCRYAVVYRRRADLAEAERLEPLGRVVMEYGFQGVWLARLIRLDAPLDGETVPSKID